MKGSGNVRAQEVTWLVAGLSSSAAVGRFEVGKKILRKCVRLWYNMASMERRQI